MRFALGDAVRTSAAAPAGHHRLPRYLRGRNGRIVAVRGLVPLADTRAAGICTPPSQLYTVAFEAVELWDRGAERNERIHADLWEAYLEPA